MSTTIFEFLGNIVLFGGTMVIATTIASFFVAQTLYNDSDNDIKISEANGEEEEEEEEPPFESLYSIDDKEVRELSEAEKEALKKRHSKVETPVGDVLMTYEDPYFVYYAKSGSIIPYRFLDVVARKFVLDHDCLGLYNKLEERKENKEENKDKEDNKENKESKGTNVFLKKKKPVSKKTVITKSMNRFKYGGQISDFEKKENAVEDEVVREEPKKMTFSDYKKMMKTD